ncbi:hypothetical protein KCU92_g383, partial [Aureobasidium melanogenum]
LRSTQEKTKGTHQSPRRPDKRHPTFPILFHTDDFSLGTLVSLHVFDDFSVRAAFPVLNHLIARLLWLGYDDLTVMVLLGFAFETESASFGLQSTNFGMDVTTVFAAAFRKHDSHGLLLEQEPEEELGEGHGCRWFVVVGAEEQVMADGLYEQESCGEVDPLGLEMLKVLFSWRIVVAVRLGFWSCQRLRNVVVKICDVLGSTFRPAPCQLRLNDWSLTEPYLLLERIAQVDNSLLAYQPLWHAGLALLANLWRARAAMTTDFGETALAAATARTAIGSSATLGCRATSIASCPFTVSTPAVNALLAHNFDITRPGGPRDGERRRGRGIGTPGGMRYSSCSYRRRGRRSKVSRLLCLLCRPGLGAFLGASWRSASSRGSLAIKVFGECVSFTSWRRASVDSLLYTDILATRTVMFAETESLAFFDGGRRSTQGRWRNGDRTASGT